MIRLNASTNLSLINCNGLDTVVQNLTHTVQILGKALEPINDQINLFVYTEQGIDLYATIDVESIVRNNLYSLLGVTEADVKEIYEQCGGTWPIIDGLEDIDFRLLFSFALAFLNHTLAENGLPFKFTSIAGLAVNELTHGYVRSYLSLTGRTAYTMVLDKSIDRYCYGDLLSVLTRIILKFLAVDGNVDALMGLIGTKVNMSDKSYQRTRRFIAKVAGYMQSDRGFESAILTIYFTLSGVSSVSSKGVFSYNLRNAFLRVILNRLANSRVSFIRKGMLKLLERMEQKTGDVVTGDGVAPHGYVPFFKQIITWFMMIIQYIRMLFQAA